MNRLSLGRIVTPLFDVYVSNARREKIIRKGERALVVVEGNSRFGLVAMNGPLEVLWGDPLQFAELVLETAR